MTSSSSMVRFAPLFILGLAACAPPSPEDSIGDKSAEIDGALRVCGDATGVQGVDVSAWQSQIDWTQVAKTSVKFAFIRVSDGGSSKDKQFDANWSGAKNAGIIRGAYQFFRPAQDPIKQADLLINATLQDPIGAGDLPAVLDVETSDGVSNATLRSRMKLWLDHVEAKTGKKPIVYTAAFMQNVVGTGFADYRLWVANYTTQCPQMPSAWSQWDIWQYSESGHVPGIPGTGVDRDIFNGTYDELVAYVGDAPTSQDPSPTPDPTPTTNPPADPGAPTGLSPSDGAAESGSSVKVQCDALAGATGYEFDIEYYQNGAWTPYYTYSPKSPSQTFWPVVQAAFRFRARAITPNGDSPYTDWDRFTFGNATLP